MTGFSFKLENLISSDIISVATFFLIKGASNYAGNLQSN